MVKRKETQAYEAVQRPVGAEKIDFKGAPAEVSKAFGASKERTVVDRNFVNKAINLIEKKDETIKGIEAVLEVYTRDKYIHPSYACEKLHYSYSNIKHVHDYFENKL